MVQPTNGHCFVVVVIGAAAVVGAAAAFFSSTFACFNVCSVYTYAHAHVCSPICSRFFNSTATSTLPQHISSSFSASRIRTHTFGWIGLFVVSCVWSHLHRHHRIELSTAPQHIEYSCGLSEEHFCCAIPHFFSR